MYTILLFLYIHPNMYEALQKIKINFSNIHIALYYIETNRQISQVLNHLKFRHLFLQLTSPVCCSFALCVSRAPNLFQIGIYQIVPNWYIPNCTKLVYTKLYQIGTKLVSNWFQTQCSSDIRPVNNEI